MLGLSQKKPIAEYEASGEIERVYHEIKQTSRVTGVNLNFRAWAAHGNFLPLMWDAVRPNAETRAFESAADQVRADAARAAEALGPPDARSHVSLGQSQAFQIRAALDLYHYVNPKLLVLTSAVAMALHEEIVGRDESPPLQRVAPGAPATMYSMEMESEDPDDERLQQLYGDIKETLSLSSVNSDYRTLALWPDYLSAAWERLKPVVRSSEYRRLSDQLRENSRRLAGDLPHRLVLRRQAMKDVGVNVDEVTEVTQSFEQLLPGLIINIALLELDWRQGADLANSPFPAVDKQPSRGAQ